MISHSVEYCSDDIVVLRERLDELVRDGGRIVTVLWQPQTAESDDQAAAISARGSFVIIVENALEQPMAVREASISEREVLSEVAALS